MSVTFANYAVRCRLRVVKYIFPSADHALTLLLISIRTRVTSMYNNIEYIEKATEKRKMIENSVNPFEMVFYFSTTRFFLEQRCLKSIRVIYYLSQVLKVIHLCIQAFDKL